MTLVTTIDTTLTAADIFEAFQAAPQAVFLDSSLKNDLGRFSIIGLNPYRRLLVKDGQLFVNDTPEAADLFTYLKAYLKDNQEENPTALPLISGAIGYFSYDLGRSIEGIPSRHQGFDFFPDCILNFYDNLIIEDLFEKKIYLTAGGHLADAETSLETLSEQIKALNAAKPVSDKHYMAVKSSDFVKPDYLAAIDRMIDYIVAGDIYIANMTRQLQVQSAKPPYEVFKALRKNNPSPFGGYFNYGDFQIVSASPERFLRLKDRLVATRPIKGTRKRGATPGEDLALKTELQNSEKDKSELLMIVDLERNDLNRVCKPGSVQVHNLFDVETYATVFHLVSDVTGELRDDCDFSDLLKATFPGGSITGAPKIRAMEIIDELEHSARGLYTGSIGYVSLDGCCDLNIVIRTALYHDGVYHLGAGGGITCESDLEFEFEETEQKAKAPVLAMS
ncbi:MAG: aminodeoxychorismate synthase component I [Eubacterium sp.]|nr:aminodeoxychorismate synthase component I [Eubacterium sp.]